MNVFNTKEQYLKFRKEWALSIKSTLNKPTFEEMQHREFASSSRTLIKTKVVGKEWVSPEHHILFNILCGRNANFGFNKITNTVKLSNNGGRSDKTFLIALYNLYFYVGQAKNFFEYTSESYIEDAWQYQQFRYNLNSNMSNYSKEKFVEQTMKSTIKYKENCDEFLKIFKNTVSLEMLTDINFLKYFGLHQNAHRTLVWFGSDNKEDKEHTVIKTNMYCDKCRKQFLLGEVIKHEPFDNHHTDVKVHKGKWVHKPCDAKIA